MTCIFMFTMGITLKMNAQQESHKWFVKPVISRNYYGEIANDSNYVDFHFEFISNTPDLISFDYGQIYTYVEQGCDKRPNYVNLEKHLLSRYNTSQLLLENEFGDFIPLMVNSIGILDSNWISNCIAFRRHVDVPKEYNWDIIYLSPNRVVTFELGYSIRYCALSVCAEHKKLRLIYVQKPNDYLKKLGLNERVLTSEWFELSDIK